MPTTVEIDGIGRVELDDSFSSRSAAEQNQIIQDIARQAGPSRPRQAPAPSTRTVTVRFDGGGSHVYQNVPGDVTPEQVTERAEREFGKRVAHLDGGRAPNATAPQPQASPVQPAAPDPMDDLAAQAGARSYARDAAGDGYYLSDQYFADEEAAYQASIQQPAGSPPSPADPASPQVQPPRTGTLEAGLLGMGDAATFGFIDEAGAALDAVLGGGKQSIWDGSSLADAYSANVSANRERLDAAQDEHGVAYGLGAVAGGLLPITGTFGAARSASTLGKLGAAAGTGAAYGAAYGFGSDEGSPLDRLDGAAMGGAVGAAGGAALHGAVRAGSAALRPGMDKLFPQAAQARFARQQMDNPHAVTDARVADDLAKLVDNITVRNSAKRRLSKDQQAVLVGRVDELEASYLPRSEIDALDLPPSDKARLKRAMDRRHLLSDPKVAALRDGTPGGEATAEGIERTRRLRAYVPEGPGSSNAIPAIIAEAAGSGLGFKAAGPLGGAIMGRVARAAVPRGSGRSAKDALALAQDAPRFAQLPQVSAARQAEGAGDSLSRLSADAMDASYNARRAAQAEQARLEAEGRRVGIANARDNVTPSGGFRGLVYERTGLLPADQDAGALKALADGAITQQQFDAFLSDPSRLMAGNAGNALIDRLSAMAEAKALTRDPKWTPPAPGAAPQMAGRAAAQAAFGQADDAWRTLRGPGTPADGCGGRASRP